MQNGHFHYYESQSMGVALSKIPLAHAIATVVPSKKDKVFCFQLKEVTPLLLLRDN